MVAPHGADAALRAVGFRVRETDMHEGRRVISKALLLEISFVAVPANPNALVLSYAAGHLEDRGIKTADSGEARELAEVVRQLRYELEAVKAGIGIQGMDLGHPPPQYEVEDAWGEIVRATQEGRPVDDRVVRILESVFPDVPASDVDQLPVAPPCDVLREDAKAYIKELEAAGDNGDSAHQRPMTPEEKSAMKAMLDAECARASAQARLDDATKTFSAACKASDRRKAPVADDEPDPISNAAGRRLKEEAQTVKALRDAAKDIAKGAAKRKDAARKSAAPS